MDEFRRKMAIRYGIKAIINALIAGAFILTPLLLEYYNIFLGWKFVVILFILGVFFGIRSFCFMQKYIDCGN